MLRYFSEDEFMMGAKNVYNKMDETFLLLLDELRDRFGHPMHINSSFRTPEWNFTVGGAKNSQHLKGNAVDVKCTDAKLRALLVKEALGLGLSVGVAKTFIHLDNREQQIVFTY